MKHFVFVSLVLAAFCFSATAQKSIVPIVDMKFGGLLGGVQNGKWLTPEKMAASVKNETEFVLVGWNGVEEGGVTFGKKQVSEDICEGYVSFEFELEMESGIAIGSNGKWNFSPRVPKNIDLNAQTYKAIVANYLKRKGLARPVVKITQAYRVDLEGDGTDEVLVAATYYKNGLSPSAAPGDYSFVLLRKAVGKIVTDHLLAGEFITKKIEFGAPSQFGISGVADLNGDGKMEIVVHGNYYEGNFASAYEMRGGRPVEIKQFSIGCGV